MKMWADNIHEHLQSHVSVCTNYQFNNETRTILPVFDNNTVFEVVGQKRKLPASETGVRHKILVKSPRKQGLYASPSYVETHTDERERRTDMEVENYLNSSTGPADRLSVILDQLQHTENEVTYYAAKPYPASEPVNLADVSSKTPKSGKKSKAMKMSKNMYKKPKIHTKANGRKTFEEKAIVQRNTTDIANERPRAIGDALTQIDLPFVVDGKELGTYHCAVVVQSFTPKAAERKLQAVSNNDNLLNAAIRSIAQDDSGDDDNLYDNTQAEPEYTATSFTTTPVHGTELQNAISSLTNALECTSKGIPVSEIVKLDMARPEKAFARSITTLRVECTSCSWHDDHIASLITSEMKRSFKKVCLSVPALNIYFQSVIEIEEFDIYKWAFRDIGADCEKQEVGTDVPDPKELEPVKVKREFQMFRKKKDIPDETAFINQSPLKTVAPQTNAKSNQKLQTSVANNHTNDEGNIPIPQTNAGNSQNSKQNAGNGQNSQTNAGNSKNSKQNAGNGQNSQTNAGNSKNSQTNAGKVQPVTDLQIAKQNQPAQNMFPVKAGITINLASLGNLAGGNLNAQSNVVNIPLLSLFQNPTQYQNIVSPFLYIAHPSNTNSSCTEALAEKKDGNSDEVTKSCKKLTNSNNHAPSTNKAATVGTLDFTEEASGLKDNTATSKLEMLGEPINSSCNSANALVARTLEEGLDRNASGELTEESIFVKQKSVGTVPKVAISKTARNCSNSQGKLASRTPVTTAATTKVKYKVTLKKIIKGGLPDLIEKEDGTVELREKPETSPKVIHSDISEDAAADQKQKIVFYVSRLPDGDSVKSSTGTSGMQRSEKNKNNTGVLKHTDSSSAQVKTTVDKLKQSTPAVTTASPMICFNQPRFSSSAANSIATAVVTNSSLLPVRSPVVNVQQPLLQVPAQPSVQLVNKQALQVVGNNSPCVGQQSLSVGVQLNPFTSFTQQCQNQQQVTNKIHVGNTSFSEKEKKATGKIITEVGNDSAKCKVQKQKKVRGAVNAEGNQDTGISDSKTPTCDTEIATEKDCSRVTIDAMPKEDVDPHPLQKTGNKVTKSPVDESKYFCQICNIEVQSRDELKVHNTEKHTHTEIIQYYLDKYGSFVCVGCGASMQQFRKFEAHVELCQDAKNCKFDMKVLNLFADFSDKAMYKCLICNIDIYGKQNVLKHNEEKHTNQELMEYYIKNTQQYVCVGCGICVRLIDSILFEKHIDRCSYAAKRGFRKSDGAMYINETAKNQKNVVCCPYCDYKTTDIFICKRHQRKCDKAPVIQCDLCKLQVKSERVLRKHKREVHKVKEFKCTTCTKVFYEKESLKSHMQELHKKEPVEMEKIICDKCGKFFPKHQLATHVKRVHEIKRSCIYCDQSFCSGEQTSIHEGIHTRDFRFSCVICRTVFPSSSAYSKHMKEEHQLTSSYAPQMNSCIRSIHALLFTNICIECKESFQEETQFLHHMKVQHSMGVERAKAARLENLKKKQMFIYREKVHSGKLVEVGYQIKVELKL